MIGSRPFSSRFPGDFKKDLEEEARRQIMNDITLPEANISPENGGPLESRRFLLKTHHFLGVYGLRSV